MVENGGNAGSRGLLDQLDDLADLSVEGDLDAPTRVASSSGSLPRLDLSAHRKAGRKAGARSREGGPDPTPAAPVSPVASPRARGASALDGLFDVEDLEDDEAEVDATRVSDADQVAKLAAVAARSDLESLDALPDLEEEDERAMQMPTRVAGTPLRGEVVSSGSERSPSEDLAGVGAPAQPAPMPGEPAITREVIFVGVAAGLIIALVVVVLLL